MCIHVLSYAILNFMCRFPSSRSKKIYRPNNVDVTLSKWIGNVIKQTKQLGARAALWLCISLHGHRV